MAAATIAPALPRMADAYRGVASVELVTKLVLTTPALAIALCAPLAGAIIDRFDRLTLLRGSLVLYGLAGAAGYVLKDLDTVGIQRAIITVGRGGSLLDPQMTTRLLERMRHGIAQHPADDQFAELTPQEDRILDMIGEGLTNRQIADRLSLSEKTVKNYVSELYAKLHVDRRTQAATLATERRLRKG